MPETLLMIALKDSFDIWRLCYKCTTSNSITKIIQSTESKKIAVVFAFTVVVLATGAGEINSLFAVLRG